MAPTCDWCSVPGDKLWVWPRAEERVASVGPTGKRRSPLTLWGLCQLPSPDLSSSGQFGAGPSLQPEPAQGQLERLSPVFLISLRRLAKAAMTRRVTSVSPLHPVFIEASVPLFSTIMVILMWPACPQCPLPTESELSKAQI